MKTKDIKKTIEEDTKKKKERIAIVRGKDIPISTKHAIAICSFIKGKKPQEAITLLENVIKKKIAVPMKGEIPHRHNMPKGKPSGRYPTKASLYFIKLLKNLIANAAVKGLNTEDLIINVAIANKASRPFRGTRIAFGRKIFKKTHIILQTIEIGKKPEEKKAIEKKKKALEKKKGEEKTEEKKEKGIEKKEEKKDKKEEPKKESEKNKKEK